jgi:RHS repeat-associated protein
MAVIGNPSTATTYNYDGEGRRVQKITTSGTTNYVYDAMGHLAAEYGGSSTSAGRVYLSVDALGSTRLVTDASGNPTEQYDYAPFGEELTQGIDGRIAPYSTNQYPTTPDAVTEKFTSKERDAETGLDYFGARYFSAAQGRFTSPDWSASPAAVPYADLGDPQTLNLYAYVRNNPLSHADADGHCLYSGGNCLDYLIGGLKAAANTVPNTATLLNRGINRLTGSSIPDAPTFQPSNTNQARGMEAANVMLAISPVAELGAANVTTTATEVPQILQNAARGAASETRVLSDLGQVKNTTAVTSTEGKSIPDFINNTTIGEIKDVKNLSNTQQLRIQRDAAVQTGRDHAVFTGTNTNVRQNVTTPPTKVIRRDDLGPKQP